MNRKIPDVLLRSLLSILSESLPKLSADWWQALVLNRLTYQQNAHAKAVCLTRLDQLDLAALLRILDQNWFEIAGLRTFQRSHGSG